MLPNFRVECGHTSADGARVSPTAHSTFMHMINGGQQQRDGAGGIRDEFESRLSNVPGTLAMESDGSGGTSGGAFYLNVEHNDFLDWFEPGTPSAHVVFGSVDEESLSTLLAISRVPTNDDGAPLSPVRVSRLTVEMN